MREDVGRKKELANVNKAQRVACIQMTHIKSGTITLKTPNDLRYRSVVNRLSQTRYFA